MIPDKDIIGKWIYGAAPSCPYGDDASYRMAIEFLDGPYILEDWGCGLAWARRFVKRARYIGLDGSWSLHADKIVDLRKYTSQAEAILLRHILEHNWDWRLILENALQSYRKKFCLVMFTPFSETTHSIGTSFDTVPDLSFRKQDLLDVMAGHVVREEAIQSTSQYGIEHLFYLERVTR